MIILPVSVGAIGTDNIFPKVVCAVIKMKNLIVKITSPDGTNLHQPTSESSFLRFSIFNVFKKVLVRHLSQVKTLFKTFKNKKVTTYCWNNTKKQKEIEMDFAKYQKKNRRRIARTRFLDLQLFKEGARSWTRLELKRFFRPIIFVAVKKKNCTFFLYKTRSKI